MSFDIREENYFNALKKLFLLQIEKTETCWKWKQSKDNHGYGRFSVSGKRYATHRLSYMLFNGPIPHNRIVRHTCDNRICVNPKHLILGSMSDNSLDAVKRNRKLGQHKLNTEAVKVIKWMLKYKPRRGLISKLARLHKITPEAITSIKYNRNWYWVKIK
jgi:hypothetical protein